MPLYFAKSRSRGNAVRRLHRVSKPGNPAHPRPGMVDKGAVNVEKDKLCVALHYN